MQLERQLQELKLDLAAREGIIAALESDVEQARRKQAASIETGIDDRMRRLMSDVAPPLTQLRALHAAERTDWAPQAWVLVERLSLALVENGLVLSGDAGEVISYDPAIHQPLGTDVIQPGEAVKVRIESAAFGSHILRRASVESAPKS